LDVLSSGRIDVKPLISHRLKLDNILQGYQMMAKKPAGFIKSLVSP
jgi:threonine dehydrogenase-like Zn-dependent dehydrogenase